ncbi:MAG: precorrin-8X methylmutase [Herpetosiphon sp.]
MMPALDPITRRSFATIDAELRALDVRLPEPQHALLRRAIHATADFALIDDLHIHPAAIDVGLTALKRGAPIVCDVRMVAVAVDAKRIALTGSRVICRVDDPDAATAARENGTTRSAVAIAMALAEAGPGAIIVVGNAPTALREVLRLGAGDHGPALVIGVPVGFVDAAESKAALMDQLSLPWISIQGRKGGSAVGGALLNALLHLVLPPARGTNDAS